MTLTLDVLCQGWWGPQTETGSRDSYEIVLGGAHSMKFPKSRDLAGLVLASRIWCKVGA